MKNKSFTLIELLVVIVIIGVLAGVIMVTTSSSVNNAILARAKAFSSNVQNSMLLNLVSEWAFDEDISPYTTAKDSWGVSNGIVHGADYNTESTSNCVFGGCYNFISTNSDYINISYSEKFDFDLEMTALVWIKGSPQISKAIFAQYDSGANKRVWRIRSSGTDSSKVVVNVSQTGSSPDELASSGVVLDNNWHFVGFTFDAGIAIIC